MARGESYSTVTVLFMLALTTSGMFASADLIPTYRDHQEKARLGVISLTGTSSNYTINLSGIVMLSLSLSAAVMLWGYINNLNERNKPGDGGYSGGSGSYKLSPSSTSLNYTMNLSGLLILGLGVAAATMFWAQIDAQTSSNNLRKRSADDDDVVLSLPVVLANMHRRFEEAAVDELICRQRIVCETATKRTVKEEFPPNTFSHAVNAFFTLVDTQETLKLELAEDKRARPYFEAWKNGKRGSKSCKALYEGCSMKPESITAFLKAE